MYGHSLIRRMAAPTLQPLGSHFAGPTMLLLHHIAVAFAQPYRGYEGCAPPEIGRQPWKPGRRALAQVPGRLCKINNHADY